MQSKTHKAVNIYKSFLSLYPESFKKMYGQEMIQTFEDMYQEEDNKATPVFWVKLLTDTLLSASTQHILLIQKQGIRQYGVKKLHITSYNIIGILLLLPFFLMLSLDTLFRIMQGNLAHPNFVITERLSHTIFFNPPAVLLWAIVFPASAAILNTIALIPQIQKFHGNALSIKFIKTTIPTLAVIGIGAGFFLLIIGHDFIPCIFNNILSHGFSNLSQTLQICRKA